VYDNNTIITGVILRCCYYVPTQHSVLQSSDRSQFYNSYKTFSQWRPWCKLSPRQDFVTPPFLFTSQFLPLSFPTHKFELLGLGERREQLPSRSGVETQQQLNLVHLNCKIWLITCTQSSNYCSAVRIFKISNRIKQLLQYSIRFETSTIIRNFRIHTVTNFLRI